MENKVAINLPFFLVFATSDRIVGLVSAPPPVSNSGISIEIHQWETTLKNSSTMENNAAI